MKDSQIIPAERRASWDLKDAEKIGRGNQGESKK